MLFFYFRHNTEKVVYFLLLDRKLRNPSVEDETEIRHRSESGRKTQKDETEIRHRSESGRNYMQVYTHLHVHSHVHMYSYSTLSLSLTLPLSLSLSLSLALSLARSLCKIIPVKLAEFSRDVWCKVIIHVSTVSASSERYRWKQKLDTNQTDWWFKWVFRLCYIMHV